MGFAARQYRQETKSAVSWTALFSWYGGFAGKPMERF
jgi:hypothetical protein